MTKAELESKHIAELHALAAEAGVSGYRMLRREELIEKLLDGKPPKKTERAPRQSRESRERRERPPRRRPAKPAPAAPSSPPAIAAEQPRRRRRRRFGRRSKAITVSDLLLPPPGRQALVYGESRAACSALLLEVASELMGASKGPDPIALLVDPSPEELAGWRREVPQAEIVAAGKARHASDAVAQAARRAEGGEDVILLVDSLSRLEDASVAQEIFDCGLKAGPAKGSLTVVAALERAA
jgi:hypothetical protein